MVGGDAAVIEAHADVFDTLGKKSSTWDLTEAALSRSLRIIPSWALTIWPLPKASPSRRNQAFPLTTSLELAAWDQPAKAAELKGRKIIEGDFSNQFSLALMLKDLKLASSLTDGIGMPSLC